MRLDFRDEEPEVIDLSPKGGVVSTLKESKVECVVSDKVRLFNGLSGVQLTFRVHPGSVSVLLPVAIPWEIACLPLRHRRYPASTTAHGTSGDQGIPPSFPTRTEATIEESRPVSSLYTLVAELTDPRPARFKSTPNCVLLATDIAARGLDIPAVDHVLHYQIPRSADTYIHRNGRTARANAAGFSMLMCAPDERKVARSLLNSVGRRKSLVED